MPQAHTCHRRSPHVAYFVYLFGPHPAIGDCVVLTVSCAYVKVDAWLHVCDTAHGGGRGKGYDLCVCFSSIYSLLIYPHAHPVILFYHLHSSCSLPRPPRTIRLHGQVEQARSILDPGLSPLGIQQAQATSDNVILADAIAAAEVEGEVLVVISPLRRTIQTAMGALEAWLQQLQAAGKPARIALAPDIQETGNVQCDTGRHPAELREEFGEVHPHLPYDALAPDWHVKQGRYVDSGPALATRLAAFTTWLQQQRERTVIVVAHHNVFLALLGVSFTNCEVRQYSLHDHHPLPRSAGADDMPLTAVWRPVQPTVSTSDEELTEEEAAWLRNPTMQRHCVDKMERWGFAMPERLR